ncbi:1606_t:CDS:1, partial [Racocetra persica]
NSKPNLEISSRLLKNSVPNLKTSSRMISQSEYLQPEEAVEEQAYINKNMLVQNHSFFATNKY